MQIVIDTSPSLDEQVMEEPAPSNDRHKGKKQNRWKRAIGIKEKNLFSFTSKRVFNVTKRASTLNPLLQTVTDKNLPAQNSLRIMQPIFESSHKVK